MDSLMVGDRVRVKERTEWWLPTKYKLANAQGTVAEIYEDCESQYVALEMDEDLIGVDKRVRVTFHTEAVEKVK